MMRRIHALISIPAILVVLSATTAGAQTDPTTVDSVSAEVADTSIDVSGTATFGGEEPVEVAFDGLGDGIPPGVGVDVERLTIQRTSAQSQSLLFRWHVDDLSTGGPPEVAQYNWDINVDGGSAVGGTSWSIKSMRSGQGSNPGNLTGWAALYSCVPAPPPQTGFTCSAVPGGNLPVVFDQDANEIRITVGLAQIGAAGGARIEGWGRNGDPAWVRTSASGALTGFVNYDTIPGFDQPYTVPSNTVRLGIAPAGTPEGAVNFATAASVSGDTFSGSLLRPQNPGDYDVWAKACFGTNCGTAKTTVTVG